MDELDKQTVPSVQVRKSVLSKETFYGDLGERLRDARLTAGRTQADLAAAASCSLPAVRRSERGAGTLETYVTLASILGLALAGRSLPPGASLGERLLTLRRRKGIGRRGLAGIAAVSVPTIAAVERGSGCHLAALERVAVALGAGLTLVRLDDSGDFWARAGTSSAHHGWTTPLDVLDALYPVVGGKFDLDPCSPSADRRTAPVRAKMHFTVDDDGLSLPWSGAVFVNPPYGRVLPKWITKARNEVALGRARLVICLVPARTDTRWWHTDVAGHADVALLRGRLAFGGSGGQAAPFPSAIVTWGASPVQCAGLRAAFPSAWWICVAP